MLGEGSSLALSPRRQNMSSRADPDVNPRPRDHGRDRVIASRHSLALPEVEIALRPTGSDHHCLVEKPVRHPRRQGVENNFQRDGICHMAVTLTVHEFGLDSQVFGSGEKVHSARRLQTTVGDRREFCRYRKKIAVLNSMATPTFPGNQCPASGFLYTFEASSFPQSKRDANSMSMASP